MDIDIHQKPVRRMTKAEVFHSEHRYILLEADKAWQGLYSMDPSCSHAAPLLECLLQSSSLRLPHAILWCTTI